MPATPKSLRQQPSRVFENYVLTRVDNVGLIDVPREKFLPGPGTTTLTDLGGSIDSTWSGASPTAIGFDFNFNNTVYKTWAVAATGFMALVDPSASSLSLASMGLAADTDPYDASLGLGSTSFLLAPWWSTSRIPATDIVNVPNAVIPTSLTSRMKLGHLPMTALVTSEAGVRYCNAYSPKHGRMLVVRWTVTNTLFNRVFQFECILYENGRIEFRYSPTVYKTKSTSPSESINAIGIFGPSALQFRDFTTELRLAGNTGIDTYRTTTHQYGGAVYDSQFTFDTTLYYNYFLDIDADWPGLCGKNGAMFVFSPPRARRKILPRQEVHVRDRLSSYSFTKDEVSVPYQDRNTVNFIANISGTNYPTRMQRLASLGLPGVEERQDLFYHDFMITGSAPTKLSIEQFVGNFDAGTISPFSEDRLYALNVTGTSSISFASGSSASDVGIGFSEPLTAKEQIKLSFVVNSKLKMLDTTSSIYYYDNVAKNWTIPQNAGGFRDISSRSFDVFNHLVPEDYRGFGPIGNPVVSGSVERGYYLSQSSPYINGTYTPLSASKALGTSYENSVLTSAEYYPVPSEMFSLPIDRPFIIEKAIIDLPIEAGTGWFIDKTACFVPQSTDRYRQDIDNFPTWFDFGGPALTVALFNQPNPQNISSSFDSTPSKPVGQVAQPRRDLIFSGTITHSFDNISASILGSFDTNTPDGGSADAGGELMAYLRHEGFLAYGAKPAAVITPITNGSVYSYTGSVSVPCVAAISNGVMVWYCENLNKAAGSNRSRLRGLLTGSIELFLTSSTTAPFTRSVQMGYINNYCRNGDGFNPSGRSLFGKEIITPQFPVTTTNPFYTGSTLDEAFIVDEITTRTKFRAFTLLNMQQHAVSPYVVMPGDKLTLAVSKTRPFFFSMSGTVSSPTTLPTHYTSGTAAGNPVHDIKFNTGSITITLFGSYVRENTAVPTSGKKQYTPEIHAIIGDEPVLDEFFVEQLSSLSGAYTDHFITGSLVSQSLGADSTVSLVTDNRGRAFSSVAVLTGTITYAAFTDTPSKALSLTPLVELAHSPRFKAALDESETYYDSIPPNFKDCMSINGTKLFRMNRNSLIFDPRPAIVYFTSYKTMSGSLISYLYEDRKENVDTKWLASYPFEPRYSEASRTTVDKLILYPTASETGIYSVGTRVDVSVKLTGSYVTQGLMFGPVIMTSSVPDANGNYGTVFHNFCDTDQFTTNALTGSVGNIDLAKGLFGFGDGLSGFASPRLQLPMRVSTTNSQTNLAYQYMFGPVIRGWKYGLINGVPLKTKAIWRRNRFGQLRDMLEQRPLTKFFDIKENVPLVAAVNANFYAGLRQASSLVGIIDDAEIQDAIYHVTTSSNHTKLRTNGGFLTSCNNISFEMTSSLPFFDGQRRNR